MTSSDPAVLVMGRASAEAYVPRSGEVCISITAVGEPLVALHPAFAAILRVSFDDGGHLVDDVTRVDPTRSITPAQAAQIAAFVVRHTDAPAVVVHCGMGVSRSVAVGRAIAHVLRCPITTAVRTLHNRHVYLAVGDALEQRLRSTPTNSDEDRPSRRRTP